MGSNEHITIYITILHYQYHNNIMIIDTDSREKRGERRMMNMEIDDIDDVILVLFSFGIPCITNHKFIVHI